MPPIRIITPADIPGAMRLKEAAGWNQTALDWHNVMRLAPEGCFGIDCDGVLAATTTAVKYSRDLAWIGMVLTAPEYRGRGLARALMEHAIEYLCDVECIKLDATDMGRPLYARLGFEDECAVERWSLSNRAATMRERTAPSADPDLALDRAAFGANRSELLHLLTPLGCAAVEGGFGMARAGTKAPYFGPCVARSAAAARCLLEWFLARHPTEAVYWDLLPDNAAARDLAVEYGFTPLRRLVRMARPGKNSFAHDDSKIFAIAGFEYG